MSGSPGEKAVPSGLLPVQVVDVARDALAPGVVPGALADAVARIHRRRAIPALRAEVGTPGLAAGARGAGKRLADAVGAGQSAEVGALARSGAGNEKAHVAAAER
jgi:hypothetical protein